MGTGVDLTGRRILLTGASSGIGAATCRSLIAAGASVAMLARRKERLDLLRGELGDRAFPVPGDVTDLGTLESVVADAAAALGGLDAVVSAAGRSMAGGLATGTPQLWRELIDLNLIGPLATVRYALPHFSAGGRRDVLIVGSAGAITPLPSVGVYGASKRGLRAACDSLRLELAPAGINVTMVMPGMFETEGLSLDGMIIDGDVPPDNYPYLVPGSGPAAPEVLADIITFAIGLPEGVAINELVVRPTGELNP
jgi:NADP-dependent 3-hydroxy acid dehydrogenase YdfG